MSSVTERTLTSAEHQPDPDENRWQQNLLLYSFVRFRWLIFLLVATVVLSCFNGRWRVGRDGALYRAVGHNLATDQGYSFRGDHERHIYPGLPLLLAGVEKLFGPEDPMRPIASLVLVTSMALLTLVVIYQLIRLYFPPWAAVCVVTGVGINRKFIQNAHDIMSDIPFLLGACIACLGIGILVEARHAARRGWGIILMVGGGAFALAMRPTFWALAAAWLIVSVAGIFMSRRKAPYVVMLLSILLLAGAWVMLDPRSMGASPLEGKYEQKALSILTDGKHLNLGQRSLKFFEENFPDFFYGVELGPGLDTLLTITILLSGILLLRRVPLWSIYIALTAGMLFIFEPVPRYFLMILPFLMLGMALLVHRLSLLVPQRRFLPELVILVGTGSIVAPNLIRDADLFMEQHALTFSGRREFLQTYRDGEWLPTIRLCHAMTEEGSPWYVGQDQLILAHEPRVISFLAGRRAYRAGELPGGSDPPTALDAVRGMNFEFGVFPADVYDEQEPTRALIEQGLVVAAPGAATLVVGNLRFTRIEVRSAAPAPSSAPATQQQQRQQR